MAAFLTRQTDLPHLGIGISTEYGAGDAPGSLDVVALRQQHPKWARFLEVGIETVKGLDSHAERWLAQNWPTTYHFLDINLDEPEDFDARWLCEVRELVERIQPAWLCGDAGLWHFGRRERGHMLLLPPILSDDAAAAMADGVTLLREETRHEVIPENPPGAVFLGDLHLLDFFARVCERGDTGMLLDCAHLAIFQRTMGHDPLAGLDAFPLDRIVEVHVAGSEQKEIDGYRFYEDAHTPAVLDETWQILEYVVARAENLKAVVFECERNAARDCIDGFTRIESMLNESPIWPHDHPSSPRGEREAT